MAIFIAVYTWKIIPGKEIEFQNCWEKGTKIFRDEHKALGSRLHRSEDGTWMAYAQWPSREVYFSMRELSPEHAYYLARMRDCIEKSEPTIFYEVMADYLVAHAPATPPI